jgi:hypothetical protein
MTPQADSDAYRDEIPGHMYGQSLGWFINWKLMTLYRRELIDPPTPERWFVLTDITNFFDSVLHDHVAEALRDFTIPPRMIGLLLFLLERLAVRDEYAHSPAIGLPVEPFDGSRTVAHLVLFAHDNEVAPIVGEHNYIRRLRERRESLTDTYYADMRTVLTARLLLLNERRTVRQWVKDWKRRLAQKGVSAYDQALLDRLLQ